MLLAFYLFGCPADPERFYFTAPSAHYSGGHSTEFDCPGTEYLPHAAYLDGSDSCHVDDDLGSLCASWGYAWSDGCPSFVEYVAATAPSRPFFWSHGETTYIARRCVDSAGVAWDEAYEVRQTGLDESSSQSARNVSMRMRHS